MHHAIDMRPQRVEVEREGTTMAVAAMKGAMGGLRPGGMNARHLVAGGAGIIGIAKMKPGQAANAARYQKNNGIKRRGANEPESAAEAH